MRRRGIALVVGVLAALCFAAPARAADPFFGLFTTDYGMSGSALDGNVAAQAATGVGTLREHIYWSSIERSPGTFDWSSLDALVDAASARGLTILPVITGTPQFYSTRPAGRTDDGWPPTDPSAIIRFAFELSHRYGALGTHWSCLLPNVGCQRPYHPIKAWEVWNEPDYPSWWRTGPNASQYVALLRDAYLGLKAGDPTADVVLGGLSEHAIVPGGFLDQLYDAGGSLWFDSLTVHPYAANVGGVVGFIKTTRAIADAHGDKNVPMRITEYGAATGGSSPWTTTPPCQAALDAAETRALSDRRGELGLRSIALLQWSDRPPDARNLWPNYTGLFNVDGTPKPALQSFTDAVAGRSVAPAVAAACPAVNQG